MGVIPRTESDRSATYWLDATRLDEASLDRLPPPVFQWALPVRASGAQLEPVPPEPPVVPQVSDVLEIDASAGFEVPAKVRLEEAFSGDEALQMRTALSSLSKDDATRQLEEFWRQSNSWIEPTDVGWRFDKDRNSVILTLSGDGKRPDAATRNADATLLLGTPVLRRVATEQFRRQALTRGEEAFRDQTHPLTALHPT